MGILLEMKFEEVKQLSFSGNRIVKGNIGSTNEKWKQRMSDKVRKIAAVLIGYKKQLKKGTIRQINLIFLFSAKLPVI